MEIIARIKWGIPIILWWVDLAHLQFKCRPRPGVFHDQPGGGLAHRSSLVCLFGGFGAGGVVKRTS